MVDLVTFFLIMMATLVACGHSLRVSQKDITEMNTYQSLLQIYNQAFIDESQVEEAETYIKHYENKDHSYISDDLPVIVLTHKLLPTIGYGNNLCRWLNVRSSSFVTYYYFSYLLT